MATFVLLWPLPSERMADLSPLLLPLLSQSRFVASFPNWRKVAAFPASPSLFLECGSFLSWIV